MAASRRWIGAVVAAILLTAGAGWAVEPLAPPAREEPLPSPELLEFLGDWDAGDGEWMGPEFFQTMEGENQEQGHGQDND